MQSYRKDKGSSADAPPQDDERKTAVVPATTFPVILNTEAKTLIRALKAHYAKNTHIEMPELEAGVRLPIAGCFVELVLVEKSQDVFVGVDDAFSPGEASMATDSTEKALYKKHVSLFTEQLFYRIGNSSQSNQRIQKVFVEGRAGVGKTTLCHYLTYRWGTAEAGA